MRIWTHVDDIADIQYCFSDQSKPSKCSHSIASLQPQPRAYSKPWINPKVWSVLPSSSDESCPYSLEMSSASVWIIHAVP